MKTEKKNELRMIMVFLLIAAIAFVLISFLKQPGAKVVVTVDGTLYKEFNLNENIDLNIENGKGGRNHLLILDGFASITEANCKDLLCVHQKKIHLSGETLVCLPNKVVVEVKAEKSRQTERSLDGVVN